MEKAWEKAIEAARGGQKPNETFVLTLDGALKSAPCRLPSAALFEQFTLLQHLSLANTGLISLEGFPCLPHLRRLVLSDNRISGGLEHLVQAGLKSLQDLDLSNNRIGTFEDLVPLSQLRLGSLDLYECPVTRLPDYRARVFDVVKSLQFLDKADREGKERFDSEEEVDSEEEDEEDVDNFNSEERANGSGVLNQDEVDFEDDEEDDELDVEEEDEYQDGVTINGHGAAAAVIGHVAANATTVNSSDEDDVEDEDDFQNVAEVQDLDGEDDDEDSDEIADDDGVAEDDEDGEGTEQASGPPGELDVQEVDDNAEDEDGELGDEEDDDEGVDNDAHADGEDEEEDYGTEYLARSVGKPEDEDGGSDFEPAEDAPEDEDIDEDGDDNHIAPGQKRSRDEVDSDSDDDDRNPKRR